jgi:hypothetical protein
MMDELLPRARDAHKLLAHGTTTCLLFARLEEK